MLTSHPNASRVAASGTGGILAVWLLGHFGVSVSAEDGAAVSTVVGSAWVFIGRDGIAGAFRRLWRGTTDAAPTA